MPRPSILLALLVIAPAAVAQPLPTPEQRAIVRCEFESLRPIEPSPLPLAGQADVDILSYELSLFLDLAAERIEGQNDISFIATPGSGGASSLVLDLDNILTVGAVERDGVPIDPASITHAGGVLTIPLTPPLAERANATLVRVSYSGVPRELGFGTLTFEQHGDPPEPVVFTLSEPSFGRGWWPCKDVPDDRALVSVHVEAPDALTVVGNGLETARVPGRAGHSITTWRHRHPIATYLVAVSASNYVTWEDSYTSRDGTLTMPVRYWVYPELEVQARADWGFTPEAIEYYSTDFYEYPFVYEKYAMVTVPLWGAMEHSTATSYGAQIVPGNRAYDFVVVHELAHQWWGDHVGPREWDSIWLNEGFATYSEALWFEHVSGRGTYLAYMRNMDPVAAGRADYRGTVHAPLDYFNGTVYDKGAWVLHMLRWLLGQPSNSPDAEPLLAILRAHGQEHAWDVASTNDFVATASRVGGQDLTWFFDQWLHREGRPQYSVGWSAAPQAGGEYLLHLRVDQLQAETYGMPVLVRMELPSGVRNEIVWNDGAQQDYQWTSSEAPTAVSWDPDGWVLKTVVPSDIDADDDGWPDWLDDCPAVPDPAQADADGNGIPDACDPGVDFDGDGVLNGNDCLPGDREVWAPPVGETLLLAFHEGVADSARLEFQHPDPLGQRAYAAHVTTFALDVLRTTGSTASQACVANVAAGGNWVDTSIVTTAGTCWLAYPWNGCPDSTDPCP